MTEGDYLRMSLGYIKREKDHINEQAWIARKGFWGVISSLAEQKSTMMQWWPLETDPQIKPISQKAINAKHQKIVSMRWYNPQERGIK